MTTEAARKLLDREAEYRFFSATVSLNTSY